MSDPPTKCLGQCPICDRDMFDGASVNRHHFVPKSRGGRAQEYAHRVCHDMIHRTWTNKELEKDFADPATIRADPRMQEFIEWVKKKESIFYIGSAPSKSRSRR